MFIPEAEVWHKVRDIDLWLPGHPRPGRKVSVVTNAAGMTPAELADLKAQLEEEQKHERRDG